MTKQKAMLPHYGEVWFNSKAMTNVLSLGNMVDKGFDITFKPRQEDAFIVNTGRGTIKFTCMTANIYAKIPPKTNARQ